ncbi:hypothetical protein [Mycobacterium kansasii]|uniref:hypothetical protein n=1 Tax=Mycobacterium kansasii TaxID=1768 RepID=UPI003A867BAD
MWCDIATAPWFGSCTECGKELGGSGYELAATPDDVEWFCVHCLTGLVRAQVLAELRAGRCA